MQNNKEWTCKIVYMYSTGVVELFSSYYIILGKAIPWKFIERA
jgi:hypothetical protein